ncbi:hypothetical protein ACIQUL_28995 [Streptomyces sp. NPDC090303]|uniref:hypothetical protein n=1 Tax=Streptomyces sp. NPDC090303 TaxID=3365960 RepID=UPI00380FF78C
MTATPVPLAEVTRAHIEAAARRRTPLGQDDPVAASWYVLVGGGLHYVRDLVRDVTGGQDSTPEARKALKVLGFSLFCWASPSMVERGHPWHTGQTD